jgi:hypothetical protein
VEVGGCRGGNCDRQRMFNDGGACMNLIFFFPFLVGWLAGTGTVRYRDLYCALEGFCNF